MQRQYRFEQGQGMTEYIIVVALIAAYMAFACVMVLIEDIQTLRQGGADLFDWHSAVRMAVLAPTSASIAVVCVIAVVT